MGWRGPSPGSAALFRLLELATVFVASWAVYLRGITVARLAGDPATYELRCAQLLLDSAAQTHPLYVLMGHAWLRLPWLNTSVGLSTLSALCASATITVVYVTVKRLARTYWGPILAAGSLTVAHTMWFHASIVECYTPNTLFLAGMLYAAVRWHQEGGRTALCLAGFLAGVGILNHALMGLGLAVLCTWVLAVTVRERRPRLDLVLVAGAAVLGLALILPLLIGDAAQKGWGETIRLAIWGGTGITGEAHKEYLGAITSINLRGLLSQSAAVAAACAYNFCSPALAVGVAGLILAWRGIETRALAGLLWLIVVAYLVFGALYRVSDFWVFVLPGYVAFAIAAGMGTDLLLPRIGVKSGMGFRNLIAAALVLSCVGLPIGVYATAAHVAENSSISAVRERRATGQVAEQKNYFRFYLWPPKNNAAAHADEEWVRQVFHVAPPRSILAFRQAYRSLALSSQVLDGQGATVRVTGLDDEALAPCLRQGRLLFVDSPASASLLETRIGMPLRVDPFGVLWQVKVDEHASATHLLLRSGVEEGRGEDNGGEIVASSSPRPSSG